MPNTVVKLINAESTWLEAAWEDRKLLIKEKKDSQKCESFFVYTANIKGKLPVAGIGWEEQAEPIKRRSAYRDVGAFSFM